MRVSRRRQEWRMEGGQGGWCGGLAVVKRDALWSAMVKRKEIAQSERSKRCKRDTVSLRTGQYRKPHSRPATACHTRGSVPDIA